MKDKIICLVGPSGSGKTTVAGELHNLGYNVIQSYTTRKPRYEGEWGHIFVDKGQEPITWGCDGSKLIFFTEFNVIAYKELYNYSYWATKEQYQGKGTSIYVVDPDGAEQVKCNVKDAEVITIFLTADEVIRFERLENREYKNRGILKLIQKCEEFEKIQTDITLLSLNRIIKDRKIFSKCKCDYVIDANRSIEEVVNDVVLVAPNTKPRI